MIRITRNRAGYGHLALVLLIFTTSATAQYTKISNSGQGLPDSAVLGNGPNDWVCTYDSNSNLIWEVKTTDGSLRDQYWTYTWYNTNSPDGNKGSTSGTSNCKTTGRCDTEKFTQDVNTQGLCGANDWRMPTVDELKSLVFCSNGKDASNNSCLTGSKQPVIDTGFFPNTVSVWYWSALVDTSNPSNAMYLGFDNSLYFNSPKSDNNAVRLVRNGQPTSGETANIAPAASFTVNPGSGFAPLNVALDASASTDSDGTITTYSWSSNGQTANGQTASMTFSTAGTFTIALTVTDNKGATASKSTAITVNEKSNIPPVAAFSVNPTSGTAPLRVNLDASASTDSDGSISSYSWSSSDGQSATGQSANFTFNNAGGFSITLTVTDNKGATATKNTNISVSEKNNTPPTAAFSITPSSGTAPLTVNLDASASTDSDGNISSYAWSSSNGQTASAQTARMTFNSAGTFTITLTVTDNKFATATKSITITVGKPEGVGYIDGQIYDACTGEALTYADISFDGPDPKTAQSNKIGTYTTKLAVGEYNVIVNNGSSYQTRNLKIKVTPNTTRYADFSLLPANGKCLGDDEQASSYKAIILAGGGPFVLGQLNHIWPATQELSDKAYRAFNKQGFSTQQIQYFTADKNDTGHQVDGLSVINGVASKHALEQAITQWASDVEDVVIYIASHGDKQSIMIDETTTLSASEFKQWLDGLQAKIKGRVTVIVEACYSGSFVPPLASNKFKRYVITSSSADQTAVISAKGAKSFSYYFWDEVIFTGELREAYRKARQATGSQVFVDGQAQKAVLDANGDGVESKDDYTVMQRYCFGQCNRRAGLAPDIIAVSPQDNLNGQIQATLQMQANSGSDLKKAWVIIQRPDYKFPSNTAISGLPQVDLTCAGDSCQGAYDNFNVNGTYRLSFYAQNSTGEISLPRTVELKQTGVDALASNADMIYQSRNGLLSIQDVDVYGQHYWVELQDQGGYSFAVKDYLPLSKATVNTPAVFIDGILTLPRLYLYNGNQHYRVQLLDSGNYVFKPKFETLQAVE